MSGWGRISEEASIEEGINSKVTTHFSLIKIILFLVLRSQIKALKIFYRIYYHDFKELNLS